MTSLIEIDTVATTPITFQKLSFPLKIAIIWAFVSLSLFILTLTLAQLSWTLRPALA
jgi:hypothetical protein